MAFDPDKYLADNSPETKADGFDPDAYLAESDAASFNGDVPRPKKDALSSLGAGTRQGVLFGYAPQVAAAMEPAVAKVFDWLNGTNMYDEIDSYADRRDKAIANEEQHKKDNPGYYLTGNVIGAVGSSIPLAGAGNFFRGAQAVDGANKVGALGRIIQAGKLGALTGAVYNPGDTAGVVDPLQLGGRAKNAVIGAATGAAVQGGGEGVAKALSAGKGLIKKGADSIREYLPTLKENADEIIEAARRQGVEVTPGMIMNGDKFQGLEASLAQSPSLLNTLGKKVQSARQKIESGVDDVLDEASPLSPFEAGDKVRRSIQERFAGRLKPVSESFDEVASHTKHMDVSEKGIGRVVKNMEGLDEVQLVKGAGSAIESKVNQYSKMLQNVKSVDQLKKVSTMLGEEARAAQGPEKQVLLQMLNKVRRLESRNLERAAIKSGQTSLEGEEIGKELIGQLKGARKGYAEIQGDARELGKIAGIKGKNLNEINQSLDAAKPEALAQKLFNTGDQRSLQLLKQKFPQEFEELRRVKIAELMGKATSASTGKPLPTTFIKNLNSLAPEMREMILGTKDRVRTAEDIKTLFQALSHQRSFNPSGTGKANAFYEMVGSTVKDIPRMGLYKAMSSGGLRKGLDDITKRASAMKDVTPTGVGKSLGAARAVSAMQTKYQDNPIFSNPQLFDLLSQNPDLIDGIENESLKKQVMQRMGRSPQGFDPQERVSDEDAQEMYLKGN